MTLTQRREQASHTDVDEDIPELDKAGWYLHAAESASTGLATMFVRLPKLMGQAAAVAWRASRGFTVLAVVCNVFSGIATATGLISVAGVAESLFAGGLDWGRFWDARVELIMLAAAAVTLAMAGIGAGWSQNRLAPLVTKNAENDFFALTTRVPLAKYDDDDFSDNVQRAKERGLNSTQTLVDHSVDCLTGLVSVAAVSVAIATFHPLLLLLLLLATLPAAWAALRSAQISYVSFQTRVTRLRRLWTLQLLMAHPMTAADVRSYQAQNWLRSQHEFIMEHEIDAEAQVSNRQGITRILGATASGVARVGVYASLAWLLVAAIIPLSAGAAAVLAMQQGSASMRQLIYAINDVYDSGLYVNDHLTFVRHTDTRSSTNRAEAESIDVPETIECRAVSLAYPGTDHDSIRDINLTFTRGQTVALVGENGSGKSTLAKVLACLYSPTTGSIYWDGQDLADVDADACRQHIAVANQDVNKWPYTAATNIAFAPTLGREYDHDAVEAAARATGAHDTISDLPHGYRTLLDKTYKHGVDISGGERQRLAAARALYRDAPILIVDEPSAALDARAEAALFHALHSRAETTILITHRLSNVRSADHIIVMDKGRIIERGDHDSLMAQHGHYAALFALQAAGYQR